MGKLFMSSISVFFCLFLISESGFASGAPGGAVHVPMGLVISQIANFALLLVIIYFFAGDSIKGFFSNMKEDYLQSENAAAALFQQAQTEKKDVEARLHQLRKGRDAALEEAHSVANQNFDKELEIGRKAAEQMKTDARMAFEVERLKAMDALKIEIFTKSRNHAEDKLRQDMDITAQKKWNSTLASRFTKGLH